CFCHFALVFTCNQITVLAIHTLFCLCSCFTALTVKFLTKRFITEYDPNLGKKTNSSEGPVNSERYLSWANVFLVVYSIDNMESFNGCQLYLQTLASHNKTFRPQTPIILLGNKKDMDRYRQVRQSDGEALASHFGCVFFEVSACQDFHSVQHVFHEAVRRARKGGACGCLVPAIYASEDKALLGVPSFTTPCYKELPVPANAKLITVKTSRAQSKRRASTLTLLKGFKIF
uniref:small monomeric GTPase n=1 Tax=Neolamprologus brichardi TaxID=32507 RepID=A0A3Q4I7M0_NEOBR